MSIGSASEQDLAAALRGNDVDSSDQWAKLITEHRPYPPGAAGQVKLQQLLIQNKVEPNNASKIMNALSP